MCTTVMPTPAIKLAMQAAFVTPFQKSPYINGARNAPASAPHEIDMRVEITVCGFLRVIIASTTEMIRNTAMKILIVISCFFSSIFSFIIGLIRSIVKVELDVSTSDESVDIDAESTRTITSPKSSEGSFSIIVGTIPSKPPSGSPSALLTKSLPKPPRK